MDKLEERRQVIENIKVNILSGRMNAKVEPGDPKLTLQQKKVLVDQNVDHKAIKYRVGNFLARKIANAGTHIVNRSTEIVGIEKLKGISGGIITSNHFNPLENSVVRHLVLTLGKKQLYIASQDTNLGMKGMIGFLMRYADTIPVSKSKSFMANVFCQQLKTCARNDFTLIYPEEEMWYNYRKPRPLRRGAYFYAAELNVPVIPCFVEIVDNVKGLKKEFGSVAYCVHVLDPIYPDPDKSPRDNSFEMCECDYQQKKIAYEQIYHKSLTYEFHTEDIAGWHPCGETEKGNSFDDKVVETWNQINTF